jgi:hypothetical protein
MTMEKRLSGWKRELFRAHGPMAELKATALARVARFRDYA